MPTTLENERDFRPRKRFAWFSAISLGAIFSAATFGLGAGNLDQMLVALKLRAAITSTPAKIYEFGDISVSFQSTAVENLPAEGVAFKSVKRATVDGKPVLETHDGRFVHPLEVPVASGVYEQMFTEKSALARVPEVLFCVILDGYHWSIPLYRYSVGFQYPRETTFPVLDRERDERRYRIAEDAALSAGWDRKTPPVVALPAAPQFIDSGWTLNWNYCDDLDLTRLAD